VDAVCDHGAWRGSRTAATRPNVAAVGAATAARLSAGGVVPDVVPDRASAADLASALLTRDGALSGRRVLWPRSDIAGRDLRDALTAAGAIVTDPVAYRTVRVRPEGLERFVTDLEARRIDVVAFLSPSSARALADLLPGASLAALAGRTLVASVGPATTRMLRELGAAPDLEAPDRTAAALAASIVERLATREGVRA